MSTDEFMNRFLDGKNVPDPMRAAQRSMRQDMPKRFYKHVTLVAQDGVLALALDGKLARTPARNRLSVADPALAEAIAAEWRQQQDVIDPATMPLTRLVNVALDHGEASADALRDDIVKYAAGDLLCYQSDDPERLAERQVALWNPVLGWARSSLDASFEVTRSVIHVSQDKAALDAVAGYLAAVSDPCRLTALHVVTTLTGSALLALALDAQALDSQTFDAQAFDANAIWAAAHVDEDVQIEIWGDDDEALARRAFRRRDYDAAAFVLALRLG